MRWYRVRRLRGSLQVSHGFVVAAMLRIRALCPIFFGVKALREDTRLGGVPGAFCLSLQCRCTKQGCQAAVHETRAGEGRAPEHPELLLVLGSSKGCAVLCVPTSATGAGCAETYSVQSFQQRSKETRTIQKLSGEVLARPSDYLRNVTAIGRVDTDPRCRARR